MNLGPSVGPKLLPKSTLPQNSKGLKSKDESKFQKVRMQCPLAPVGRSASRSHLLLGVCVSLASKNSSDDSDETDVSRAAPAAPVAFISHQKSHLFKCELAASNTQHFEWFSNLGRMF